MERLQKYIASSGYTSRRKAEDLIREGRVSVNGQVVTELGTKVKSGDVVLIDGEAIVGENKETSIIDAEKNKYIFDFTPAYDNVKVYLKNLTIKNGVTTTYPIVRIMISERSSLIFVPFTVDFAISFSLLISIIYILCTYILYR